MLPVEGCPDAGQLPWSLSFGGRSGSRSLGGPKSDLGMAFPVPGTSILLLNRHTGKQSRCSRKMAANEQGRGKRHRWLGVDSHKANAKPHHEACFEEKKGCQVYWSWIRTVSRCIRVRLRERGSCSKRAKRRYSNVTRLRSSSSTR